MHPEDALLDEWPAACETSSLTVRRARRAARRARWNHLVERACPFRFAAQAAGASDGCAYTQRDDSDADACGSDDDEEEPECGKRPRHRVGRTRVRSLAAGLSTRRLRMKPRAPPLGLTRRR
jgi:hypothetical protein